MLRPIHNIAFAENIMRKYGGEHAMENPLSLVFLLPQEPANQESSMQQYIQRLSSYNSIYHHNDVRNYNLNFSFSYQLLTQSIKQALSQLTRSTIMLEKHTNIANIMRESVQTPLTKQEQKETITYKTLNNISSLLVHNNAALSHLKQELASSPQAVQQNTTNNVQNNADQRLSYLATKQITIEQNSYGQILSAPKLQTTALNKAKNNKYISTYNQKNVNNTQAISINENEHSAFQTTQITEQYQTSLETNSVQISHLQQQIEENHLSENKRQSHEESLNADDKMNVQALPKHLRNMLQNAIAAATKMEFPAQASLDATQQQAPPRLHYKIQDRLTKSIIDKENIYNSQTKKTQIKLNHYNNQIQKLLLHKHESVRKQEETSITHTDVFVNKTTQNNTRNVQQAQLTINERNNILPTQTHTMAIEHLQQREKGNSQSRVKTIRLGSVSDAPTALDMKNIYQHNTIKENVTQSIITKKNAAIVQKTSYEQGSKSEQARDQILTHIQQEHVANSNKPFATEAQLQAPDMLHKKQTAIVKEQKATPVSENDIEQVPPQISHTSSNTTQQTAINIPGQKHAQIAPEAQIDDMQILDIANRVYNTLERRLRNEKTRKGMF